MNLPSELVSSFVKATKDTNKPSNESTVYGEVSRVEPEKIYVRIDGSDQDTPISTTADVAVNDRVVVMIKNHAATVVGNISNPSAATGTVNTINEEFIKFKEGVFDSVITGDLSAQIARIEALETGSVTVNNTLSAHSADIKDLKAEDVEINKSLTAAEARINKLESTSITTDTLDAKYATVDRLEAVETDIYNLDATYGDFQELTTTNFSAVNGEIAKLKTDKAAITDLNAAKARIGTLEAKSLTADSAEIKNLQSDIADIDTLIFGSASGDSIQSSFANAVIAQLGNAQIKSAMIESVSANKINSGEINTNNVIVKSDDGKLQLSDETIQISDGTRVRVQIGKDASNDYSINIWDDKGNLMFSKGGITDSAIKSAIIRDDMVKTDANISASKLNIESLFNVINNDNTNTLKASKVKIDSNNQTLEASFTKITSDIGTLNSTVSSQGTAISAIQGQISSKVWQQDINTAKNEMSTQYSTLNQEVDSISATVAEHTTKVGEASSKIANLETNLSGFKSTVSNTYATKTDMDNIDVGGRNLLLNTSGKDLIVKSNGAKANYSAGVTSVVNSNGVLTITCNTSIQEIYYRFMTPADSNKNLYGLEPGKQYTLSGKAKLTTTSGTLINLVARTQNYIASSGWYGGDSDTILTADSSDWVDFSSTFTIDANATGCYTSIQLYYTDSWSGTITLKDLQLESGKKATPWSPAPEDFATIDKMNSAITQTADSITSSVRESYTTKTDFNNMSIGGRNLVSGTDDSTEYTGNVTGSTTGYKDVWARKTIDIPTGTEYIVSFDAKADVAQNISCFFYSPNTTLTAVSSTGQSKANAADGACQVSITTEWARYWVKWTQTPATAQKSIIVGRNTTENNIYIRAVKFEAGNKPTAWSPAPEDMATAKDVDTAQNTANTAQETASNAETLIQQLSHSISMLVTDGNGTSLMTQTEDGWTFSTADIQANVADVAEGLDALTNDLGDTANTVDVLKQAVDDLGEIAEYVKIGTYENEPCIELGESDSEFKMRITNTRILFMEGSNVVAYISNQSLHIKKAVIEEELQQGGFVWKVRSNGNMGLVWKGVSS